MKKPLAAFLFLLAASANAAAAQSDTRGFYAGVVAGASTLEDDGLFAGFNFDDSGNSYGFVGGYKFFRYLAAEVRVQNLGSYSVEGESFDVTGVSAHAVGIVPLGRGGWELFGQLGVGSLRFDSDCCGGGNSTAGSAGLGVRYYPTAHLGLSLQVDAYAWQEDGYYDTYNVGVRTAQLGVHYLF